MVVASSNTKTECAREGVAQEHPMDLTVLICTWNRSQSLSLVLASLEACLVPNSVAWEILVVDNNSSDDTRAVCESFIKENPQRFRYLFEGKQGKTNALNAGIQQARGEILALTDDDLTVDQNWVAEIYRAFQQYDCAGVGGKIVPVWGCKQPGWMDLNGPFRHPAFGGIVNFDEGDSPHQLTSTVAGANMALRKGIVQKYGPYRSDLNRINSLLGGEDTEYCRRLMSGGERLMYIPTAIVYHPVDERRTTRKYTQSFGFHYGRWSIRVDGVPPQAKCFFGVPRYLFPVALKYFAKWTLSVGVKQRFFYKLELCHTLGQMAESRRWLKSQRSPQQRVRTLDPVK
jgi:glucosyl-dolichyl phosphate glucuronosyltransferase